jgi:hypothetical protein
VSRNRILIIFGVIFLIIILSIILYNPKPEPHLPDIPAIPVGMNGEQGEDNLTLHIGWNMVSMPECTKKTDVYFTYDNISYNWTKAIDIPLIVDTLLTYDGNTYIQVDVFLKTRGYWLYSFVEPLYISSEPLVLCCKTIYFDGNETLNCTRLIISPKYDTVIHCKSINVQEVSFYYYDIGKIP